jgi:hypothetical protein
MTSHGCKPAHNVMVHLTDFIVHDSHVCEMPNDIFDSEVIQSTWYRLHMPSGRNHKAFSLANMSV